MPGCAPASGARADAAIAVAAFYAPAASCSRRAPPPTRRWRRSGSPPERVMRWDRGVDTGRFDPALRDEALLPGELRVLYAGRITRRRTSTCSPTPSCARTRATRACTSCSPAAAPSSSALRERLGEHASFLGWLEGDELARAYASADMFCSRARPTPSARSSSRRRRAACRSLAVAARRPARADRGRRHGLLREPERRGARERAARARRLAAAARAPRRGAACAQSARRTWERTLERLADGYRGRSRAAPGAEAARCAPERARPSRVAVLTTSSRRRSSAAR